jgi:hypothetical protein
MDDHIVLLARPSIPVCRFLGVAFVVEANAQVEGEARMYVHEALVLFKQEENLARAERVRLIRESLPSHTGVFRRGYAALRRRLELGRPVLVTSAEGTQAAA